KKEKTISSHYKFNYDFLDFLNSEDISFDYFKDTGNRYHFKLDTKKVKFKKVLKDIKSFANKYNFSLIPIEIRREEKKTTYLYKTDFSGITTHFLLINSLEGAIPTRVVKIGDQAEADPKHPKIAFIIDDIGAYNIGAYELKKLGIPITASVLPDSPHALEEAKWLSKYNLKALIHLPMQPKKDMNNYPDHQKVITMTSSLSEIKDLVKRARKIVPDAKGINNHQGSLITSDKSMMKKVLSVIKNEGMYFIDSKTDFDSLAWRTARDMSVKTAVRDVFLDHTRSYEHSMFQIRRLVGIAKRTGKGIAIGHPFDTTLSAIADSLDFIRSSGVEIVFVNQLIR
ncbi:MAG: divergent polysaccharide deacetylase family protein, partial [Candidatus Aminicenantes bacterium]|nr:divergent polysaccharide deacetylase family protein [Candidatus Aminicenantes bacterium]